MLLLGTNTSMARSVWSIPKSKGWWHAVNAGLFGEMWWKTNLRMHKSTFDYFCEDLQPYIACQRTVLHEQVAVTLCRLATNAEYRTLSSIFGLGISTVCTVVLDTCHAITKILPRYVSIPQGDRLRDIVNAFEACWRFPQAAGAIGGAHTPILRPPGESGNDY